jgi:hypothetical protein
MGFDKFNELSGLITSAEKAIEGFNETNKDKVKGEIIRINGEMEGFKSKDFKNDLARLDELDDRVYKLLDSDKNESYNESLKITREHENDDRSISKMVIKISALAHGVRYPKNETDVPSEAHTITESIDERLSTIEEQVKELQAIVKVSRGGKTKRRKRSRKGRKSCSRR